MYSPAINKMNATQQTGNPAEALQAPPQPANKTSPSSQRAETAQRPSAAQKDILSVIDTILSDADARRLSLRGNWENMRAVGTALELVDIDDARRIIGEL